MTNPAHGYFLRLGRDVEKEAEIYVLQLLQRVAWYIARGIGGRKKKWRHYLCPSDTQEHLIRSAKGVDQSDFYMCLLLDDVAVIVVCFWSLFYVQKVMACAFFLFVSLM